MTRNTQRLLRKMVPYFSVLVIGLLVIIGVVLFTDQDREPAEEDHRNSSDFTQGIVDEQESPEEIPSASVLIPDAPTVPAADNLKAVEVLNTYFQAKIDGDVATLNNIVDSDREYTESEEMSESEYIDRYDDFVTYVLPGLTDSYFIVYVRYNIYFKGIATGAPSLNHYVIYKDADGYFCIYDRQLSPEFQSYLQETESREEILKLKQDVETDLQKACEENVDLKFFIDMLKGAEETSPVSEENVSEETAPASEENPSEESSSEESGS